MGLDVGVRPWEEAQESSTQSGRRWLLSYKRLDSQRKGHNRKKSFEDGAMLKGQEDNYVTKHIFT